MVHVLVTQVLHIPSLVQLIQIPNVRSDITHGVRCPKKTGKSQMGRHVNDRTELTNIALANLRRCNQKEKIKMDKRRTSSAISIFAPSTVFSEYGKVVS